MGRPTAPPLPDGLDGEQQAERLCHALARQLAVPATVDPAVERRRHAALDKAYRSAEGLDAAGRASVLLEVATEVLGDERVEQLRRAVADRGTLS